MAQGPTPPQPPTIRCPSKAAPPSSFSSPPSLPDWFSLVSRKGLPGPTKQGVLHLQPLELHWGATVSLEASRLLPSRLVGFPLPPPTFNHLFTAVTQRKASPGGNTPNRLELGLFGEFLGRGANQQGGEVGSLAGEDALQLRFFCQTRIFEERQQRRKPLGCPIVNRRNPPHPLPIFALTLTDQHSFLNSLRIPFACWWGC